MTGFMDDPGVADRVLRHIADGTTDRGDAVWREPVANYRSGERLDRELCVLRSFPTPFCPSAALPEVGSWVARKAAGTPLLAVRGRDGRVRVFRNACRHRGTEIANGSGCAKAFVCPYHGWTYRLDGRLGHVTHEDGFPHLDKEKYGLVPVAAEERSGLVFVTQHRYERLAGLQMRLFAQLTPAAEKVETAVGLPQLAARKLKTQQPRQSERPSQRAAARR